MGPQCTALKQSHQRAHYLRAEIVLSFLKLRGVMVTQFWGERLVQRQGPWV